MKQFDGRKECGEEIVEWSKNALELHQIENKYIIKIPEKHTAALKAQYAHATEWIIKTWVYDNCYFVCSDAIKKFLYKK